MNVPPEAAVESPYRVLTTNIDRPTENQVHTPGAAGKGFRASVVTGAVVFGQMTHPLVARYGSDWLERHWYEVRFMKPAYDGDALTIQTRPDPEAGQARAYRGSCFNAAGTELTAVATHRPDPLPEPDPLSRMAPIEWEGERKPVSWELMAIDRPFRTYHWHTTLAEHRQWCDTLHDDLPIYREGKRPPLHPGAILDRGSKVISNQFYLDFWVHATSKVTTRRSMRVGDHVEVRCVPLKKWENKGNEWGLFYQVFLVEDVPCVEIVKTSIFRVRQVG